MGSPNDDLRSGRRDERARRHRDDDDDDDEDEDDESSDGTTPRRGHRRFSDVARSPRDLTAARRARDPSRARHRARRDVPRIRRRPNTRPLERPQP